MAQREKFQVVSPEFRIAFPNLFTPKAFQRNGKDTGKPKYGFTALFPVATDISTLKQTAMAAAKAKWPGLENLGTAVRWPFKDGNKEAERLVSKKGPNGEAAKSDAQVAFYRGNVLLKASTEYQPEVLDKQGNVIVKHDAIYSGCYCYAEFDFVANEIEDAGETKRYVSAYFNFIMKARDGERLSGRDGKTVFKNLLGGASNADPTKGLDDIPF